MLYSNFRLPIEFRQVPEDNFRGAILGQCKAGSRHFYLEAPREVGNCIDGNRHDLFINLDHSRPDQEIWRVSKATSDKIYLLLSSRRPDGRDYGIGCIQAPAEQPIRLISYGSSSRNSRADWQIALLEASLGDVFTIGIRTGRRPSYTYYIVGDNQVVMATEDDLATIYTEQLRHLKHNQRRYTVADLLRDSWRDVVHRDVGTYRPF